MYFPQQKVEQGDEEGVRGGEAGGKEFQKLHDVQANLKKKKKSPYKAKHRLRLKLGKKRRGKKKS